MGGHDNQIAIFRGCSFEDALVGQPIRHVNSIVDNADSLCFAGHGLEMIDCQHCSLLIQSVYPNYWASNHARIIGRRNAHESNAGGKGLG